MVSLKKKEWIINKALYQGYALKWARKLPRKTETYESAVSVFHATPVSVPITDL